MAQSVSWLGYAAWKTEEWGSIHSRVKDFLFSTAPSPTERIGQGMKLIIVMKNAWGYTLL
jgi:hypothetical protein